jgi:hypothetical protein
MREPERIEYVTPDKNILRESLRKEKAVWELSRKHAQSFWDELIKDGLLTYRDSALGPVALISVMQSQVLWDISSAWNLAPKPRPLFFTRLKEAIRILWT